MAIEKPVKQQVNRAAMEAAESIFQSEGFPPGFRNCETFAAIIDQKFAALIKAAEWAERELVRLEADANAKTLGKNKCLANLRTALAQIRGVGE